MKKIFSSLLIVSFLLLTLTGCGPANNSNNSNGNKNNGSKNNNTTDTSQLKNMITSYEKYSEAKGALLEKITDEENYNLSLSLGLLPVALVDFALILPAAICGLDKTEVSYWSLLYTGFNYDVNGNKCTITYNDDGEIRKYVTEYDAASDSVKMEVFTGDKLELVSEYIKVGSGYASQYYSASDDTASIYRIIFDDKNISVGIFDDNQRPSSIYKNASGLNEEWTRNEQFWAQYKNGVTTGIINGEAIGN